MPDTARIIDIDDSRQADWDYFVRACPRATHSHLYGWRRICRDYFGFETHYIACVDNNDHIEGTMPLVHQKGIVFGDTMRSMPYVNYGGAVAKTEKQEYLLMQHARKLAVEASCKLLECRDNRPRNLDWICRKDKVAMILELPQTPDDLGKTLGSKIRSQIRRPQRSNPEVHIGGHEFLDGFYDIFAQNMRDLGTPVYPKEFFKRVFKEFKSESKIVCIHVDERPAAAAFLIGFNEGVEIPWAASRIEYKPIGINMLLYWEALGYAISSGYKKFDFGRSSLNGGTYRFKKQWGAKPHQLYWYLDGPKATSQAPKESSLMRFVSGVWSKLPLSVTNLVGPLIAKQLPW